MRDELKILLRLKNMFRTYMDPPNNCALRVTTAAPIETSTNTPAKTKAF